MTTVDRLGEGLARRINRRRILRRAGAGIFGLAAAWATEGIGRRGALAIQCQAFSGDTVCRMPNDRRCKRCDGSACRPPCRPHVSFYPATGGCWCTQQSTVGGVTGHYECCDCSCSNNTSTRDCGCTQFVAG